MNLSYINFRKIPENRDFSILAIFSLKTVKIFKIIETHDPKSVGSWNIYWSFTFCKVLRLESKKFWFYSPQKLVLGTILHEILLFKRMEVLKFKLSYFSPLENFIANWTHNLGSKITAHLHFLWIDTNYNQCCHEQLISGAIFGKNLLCHCFDRKFFWATHAKMTQIFFAFSHSDICFYCIGDGIFGSYWKRGSIPFQLK